MIVDTGGLLGDQDDPFAADIMDQAKIAIDESDVVLLLVDLIDGWKKGDSEIAKMLREKGKKIILVANKADNFERLETLSQFQKLGLGTPLTISAIHGEGALDLLNRIVELLPPPSPHENEEMSSKTIRIAIIGQPNVGKSSLVNCVLGHDRVIVTPIPGTTHDPTDHRLEWRGDTDITLIDTAGIKRRALHDVGLERSSVLWSMKVIERSHVCLLIVDPTVGVTDQESRIASHIIENNKSVVVVINKWDLVKNRFVKKVKKQEKKAACEYEEQIRDQLGFLSFVPVLYCSAKTGFQVDLLLDLAIDVYREREKRIKTHHLHDIIKHAKLLHKPPTKGKRKLTIKHITQADQYPPTFIFFVNHPDLATDSYQRFLSHKIREFYPFKGTPLRLLFRENDANEKMER